MKNLTVYLSTLIIVGFLALFSCKKETQTFDPKITSNPSEFELLSFFRANENNMKQNFTVNSSQYIDIRGNQGTRITIAPNSFEDENGNPVFGNVQIELIEIMDVQSMVLSNKSTNGRLLNGDVSPLISGGQIKLNATKGGKQLKFRSGSIYTASIPVSNMGGLDLDMNKFTGLENPETNGIIWGNEDNSAVTILQDTSFGHSYTWSDSGFGWTNMDRFFTDPRPKTTPKIKLPIGFDETNSSVFLIIKGEPRALVSLWLFNETTKMFSGLNGTVPVGLEVHFLIVSEVNGQLKYSIVSTTISNNHIEIIPSLINTTKSQLTADIIGLP